MNPRPLAYHITFGTYGTRLHGDVRGTVDRRMNGYRDPIVGSDPSWWSQERGRLKFPPVKLSPEEMVYAESVIPSTCERGGWTYHAGAAGPDHIHGLLSADAEGDAVRRWFKRWIGEALSSQRKLPDGATWWAEGGSVKWVWTDEYLDAVFDYVDGQRASGRSRPRNSDR